MEISVVKSVAKRKRTYLYETKTLVWYYVASTAMVMLSFVHKVDH